MAGASVVVHGRDRARGEAVVAAAGPGGASLVLGDLSSLAGARALAAQVGPVDVLVNNAGVVSRERRESADGIELTFAVNYVAHVALTLELLERGPAPRRIVNVASLAAAPVDLDAPYEPYRAYGMSKLAQVMWTFDLGEQLDPARTTVNALHPATLMDTTMVRELFGRTQDEVEDGAAATVRLVTDPALDGVTGRFFDGTRETRAHRDAYDSAARARLRALTAELLAR